MHVPTTGAAGMIGRRLAARIAREGACEIVKGWPTRVDARRALALGFRAAQDFDEIIRIHVEDDLGGRLPN